MRNILLIILLLPFALICSGQNIRETIDYRNNKLEKYDHTSFLTRTMNSEFAPDWNISSFNKWTILDNGEVIIEQIINEEGEKSIAYEIRFFIKKLSDPIV